MDVDMAEHDEREARDLLDGDLAANLETVQSFVLKSSELWRYGPESLKGDLQHENDVSAVLVRQEWATAAQELRNALSEQAAGAPPTSQLSKHFTGVGGAGKTTGLFMIAEVAWRQGAVVIPMFGTPSPRVFATALLLNRKRAQFKDNTDFQKVLNEAETVLRVQTQAGQANAARNLVANLTSWVALEWTIRKPVPVVWIIDEYNAMWSQADGTEPFFAALRTFSDISDTLMQSGGGLYTAVSSSFGEIYPFTSGDVINRVKTVLPCSETELLACCKWPGWGLPSSHGGMEDVRELTGGVMRMLYILRESMRKSGSDSGERKLTDAVRKEYGNLATLYYKQRVQKIIEKGLLGTDAKDSVVTYAATMAARRGENSSPIPALWKDSGLFVQDAENKDSWSPVSTIAWHALLSGLRGELNSVIEVLTKHENSRWVAFELAFLMHFEKQNDLCLPFTNVHGVKIKEDTDKITLSGAGMTCIFPQPDMRDIPQRVTRKTLIVCPRNYPVVDFVAFDSMERVWFIQLSTSSYGNHKSKLKDLFKTQSSCALAGTSVYTWWLTRCGLTPDRRASAEIPVRHRDKVFFVYLEAKLVATTTRLTRGTKSGGVVLAGGQQLKESVCADSPLQVESLYAK